MKLDLLYEIDVPKPWPGPHPYGQRKARAAGLREALEQIKLADTLGLQHRPGTSSTTSARAARTRPAPEVMHRRAVPGAPRTSASASASCSCRTASPRRSAWPRRWRPPTSSATAASSGAPGRSTPMEQTAFGVDRDASREPSGARPSRPSCRPGSRSTSRATARTLDFPEPHGRPRSRSRTRTRRAGWRRRATASPRSPAASGSGLLSFVDHAAGRADGRAHPRSTATRPPNAPTPITRVTNNRVGRLHARALRRRPWRRPRRTASGTRCGGGTRTSPSSPSSGSSPTSARRSKDAVFPLLKPSVEGNFDPQQLQRRTT